MKKMIFGILFSVLFFMFVGCEKKEIEPSDYIIGLTNVTKEEEKEILKKVDVRRVDVEEDEKFFSVVIKAEDEKVVIDSLKKNKKVILIEKTYKTADVN